MQLPNWFKQLLWQTDDAMSAPGQRRATHRQPLRLAVRPFEERRVLDASFDLTGGVITLDGFTDESLTVEHDNSAGQYVFTLNGGSTWVNDPDATPDNVARISDTGVTSIVVDASPTGMDPAPAVDVVLFALADDNDLETLTIGVSGGEVGNVNGDQIRFIDTLEINATGDATFKAANNLGLLRVTADVAEFHNDAPVLNPGGFTLGAVDVNELIIANEDTDISSNGELILAAKADITSDSGVLANSDITFSNASFGELTITTDGDIDITEADDIELTKVVAGGSFDLAADGKVTVTSVTAKTVNISKSSSITTGSATTDPVISVSGGSASIALTSSGDVSGKSDALFINAGGGDVTLTRTGTGDFLIEQTGASAHSLSIDDQGASGSITYEGNANVTVNASSFEGTLDLSGSALTVDGVVQGAGDIALNSTGDVTFNTGAGIEAAKVTISAGSSIEVDDDDLTVELEASTISLTAAAIGSDSDGENLNFSNATSLTIFKQAGAGAFLKEAGKSSESTPVATVIENKNTSGDISVEFATDLVQVDATAGKHVLTSVSTTGAFSYDAGASAIASSAAKLSASELTLTTTGALSLGSSGSALEVDVDGDLNLNAAGTTSGNGGVFLESGSKLNVGVINVGTGDAELQSDVAIALDASSSLTASNVVLASNSTTANAAATLSTSQVTLLGATTATSIGVGDDASQTASISTATLGVLDSVSTLVIGDAGLNAAVEIHEDDGLKVNTAFIVRGKSIAINSDVTTTGGFTIEGTSATTTVLADQSITETGAGDITINDSVLISSGATLTLDTQAGAISITGDIQGVGGTADAHLVAKSVSGDIALGDSPINDTIEGAGGVGQFGDVTATTSGEVKISAEVDANSLNLTAGSVVLRDDITTLGVVEIAGDASIDNDVTIIAGGDITMDAVAGDIDAKHAFSAATATGALEIGELGGGGKSLTTVALTGATVELSGNITTGSTVSVSGATTLGVDVTVTADDSSVQFNGAVDSSTGAEALQVNAGSGDVTFLATAGGTKTLESFSVQTTGDVSLAGVKTGSGDIVIGASGSKAGALTLSGDYESGGKAEFFATSAGLVSGVSVSSNNDKITIATGSITTTLNAGNSEHGLTLNAGAGASAQVDLSGTAIGATNNHLDHLVITGQSATLQQVLLGDGQSRSGPAAGTALEVNVVGDLTLSQNIDTTGDATADGGAVAITTGGITLLDATGSTVMTINTAAVTSSGAVTLGKVDSTAAGADGLQITAGDADVAIGAVGASDAVALLSVTGGTLSFDGNIGSTATAGVTGKVTATAADNVDFGGSEFNASGGFDLTTGAGGLFNINGGATSFVSAGESILFNTGEIVIAAGGALSVEISGGAGADEIAIAAISGPSTADVTLNATAGIVSLGTVGASLSHLDELDVTGSAITLAGSIFAGGKASFTGDTTVENSLSIETSSGPIAFTGASDILIENGSKLTLNSGGATTIGGDVTAETGDEDLAIQSAGNVTLGTSAATNKLGTAVLPLDEITISTTADVTVNAVVSAGSMTITGDANDVAFKGAVDLDSLNAGGVNALEIEAKTVAFEADVDVAGGGAISVGGAGGVGSGVTLQGDLLTDDGKITIGLDATLAADVLISSFAVTGADVSVQDVNGGGHSLTVNAGGSGDFSAADIGSGAAVDGLDITNAAGVSVQSVNTVNGLRSTSDSFQSTGAVLSTTQAINITARGDDGGVSIDLGGTVEASGQDVLLTAANDIVFGDEVKSTDGDGGTHPELCITGIDNSTSIHFGDDTTGAAGVHISVASVSNIGGAADSEFSGGINLGDGGQIAGADIHLGASGEIGVDQNLTVASGAADIVLENTLTTAGHDVTFDGENLVVAADAAIGKSTDRAAAVDLSGVQTSASQSGIDFAIHASGDIHLGTFSDASGAQELIETLLVATPPAGVNVTSLSGDIELAEGGTFNVTGDADIVIDPAVGTDVSVTVAGGTIDWGGSEISAVSAGTNLLLSIDNAGAAPLDAITFGNVGNTAGNFLNNLTILAKDGVFADAGAITTGSSIVVSGDVEMTGKVAVGASGFTVQTNGAGGSGAINFSDAQLDGNGAVDLQTGASPADDVLLGEVGGTTAVAQLSVTTAGELTLAGDITTAAGDVNFTNAGSVVLNSDVKITTGNGAVLFDTGGDLDGGHDLEIATGTGSVQLGNVGANTALSSMNIAGNEVTFGGAMGALVSAGVTGLTQVNATGALKFEDTVYHAGGGFSLTAAEHQINASSQQTTFTSTATNISFLGGNIQLSEDASLKISTAGTSSGNGDIAVQDVAGDGNGSGDLSLDAGDADLSVGLIGDLLNKDRINAIALAGATVTLDAHLVAADSVDVDASAGIVLTEDTEICTVTGDVTLAGNITGDADVNREDLTVMAGNAVVLGEDLLTSIGTAISPLGALDIQATSDVTIQSPVFAESITIAGNGAATADTVSFAGGVTLNGVNAMGDSLAVAGESINLGDSVEVLAGGGNILLTGAAAVAGNDVSIAGKLDVSAVSNATITIDAAFDDVLLDASGGDAGMITNEGVISIASAVTLATDVLLLSNNGANGANISLTSVSGDGHTLAINAGDGDLTATGHLGQVGSQLNGLSVASSDAISLQSVNTDNGLTVSSSQTFTASGTINSSNAAVAIRAENGIGAAITLNALEANGSDVHLTSGGDIVFASASVNSAGGGSLTIEGTSAGVGIQFGSNAGVDGVVDISLGSIANIGTGFTGGIVLGRTDQTAAVELGQSGAVAVTQGIKILAGNPLGAGAAVTVTSNVTADGGFEIDGSGTTTVSVAGSIATDNAAIDIDAPVGLTADGVTLQSAGGDISLNTVDADAVTRSLTVDAGVGDISVQAVGAGTAVTGGVSMTAATINAASIDTSSATEDTGGAVTLTAATINLDGDIQTAGKLDGGHVKVDGAAHLLDNFTASTGAGGGDILFTGDVSSASDSETFTLSAGTGDVVLSGDVSTGQFAVSTAKDVSLQSVNSNGGTLSVGAVGVHVSGVLDLHGDLQSDGADIGLFAQSVQLQDSVLIDSTGAGVDGDITLATVINPGLTPVGDVGLSLAAGDGEIDLGGATVNGLDHFNLSATVATLNDVSLGDGNQNVLNPGDALHVDAATRLTLAGDIVTSGGGVDLSGGTDGVVLNKSASNLVSIATSGGDISIGSVIATATGDTDGLSLNAATGDVTLADVGVGGALDTLAITADETTLNGDVGTVGAAGVTGLASINSSSSITYGSGVYHATGGLQLTAAVHHLSQDTSILSGAGDIALTGSIEDPVDSAESSLTITATSGAVTVQSIGRAGKADIGAVALTGGTSVSLGGDIFASSLQVTGNTTLTSDIQVNTESRGGDIQFSAGIDGAHQLMLDAVDGDVKLGGAVGGSTRLGALTVETGQTLLLGGDVLLDGGGDIDFSNVKLLDVDDGLTDITFDTDAALGATDAGSALLFAAAGDPFVETGLAVTIDTTVDGTGADAAITLVEMDVRSLAVAASSIEVQQTTTRGDGSSGGDIQLTATGAGQAIVFRGDLDTSQSVSGKAGAISIQAANGTALLNAGGAAVNFITDGAAADADIKLDIDIDSQANEAFSLNAGGGAVDINGVLGASGKLGLLTMTGGDILLGADISASGFAASGSTSIDIDAAGVKLDTGGVDSFFQSNQIDNSGGGAEIRGGGVFVYRGNTVSDAISIGGGGNITTAAVTAINAGAGGAAISTLQIGHADNQAGRIVVNEAGTLTVNAELLIEADDATVEINDDIQLLPSGASLIINAAANGIEINNSGAGIALTTSDGEIALNGSILGSGKDITLSAGSADVSLGSDASLHTIGASAQPLGDVAITTTGDVAVNAKVHAASVSVDQAGSVDFENQLVLHGGTVGGDALRVEATTIGFNADATLEVRSTGGNVFLGGSGAGSSLTIASASLQVEATGATVEFDNQFDLGVNLAADVSTTSGAVTVGSALTITDSVTLDTTLGGSTGASVTLGTVDAEAAATATNLARQLKIVAGTGAIDLGDVGQTRALTKGADSAATGGVDLQGGAVTVTSITTSNGNANGAGGDVKIDSASAEVGDITTSGNGKASGAVDISTSAGDGKLMDITTGNAAVGTATAGQASGGDVQVQVADGNLTLNTVLTTGDNANSGNVSLTTTGAGSDITVAAGIDTRVTAGDGDGGDVSIDATGDVTLTGDVQTSSTNSGAGGAVVLKADGAFNLTGDINTSGAGTAASGDVTVNDAGGSLILGADTTVTTQNAGAGTDGDVLFNGAVDGAVADAQSLVVETGDSGVTTFAGSVGSLQALRAFHAKGDVTLTGDVASFNVDTTQQYDGAVLLDGIATSATRLTATTVQFNDAVNASAAGLHQLEVHATLDLNADIGATAGLNALTVTGVATFNGASDPQQIVALTQEYRDDVVLNENTEITGSDITFQQGINGTHSLLIDASASGAGAGSVSLVQSVGDVTALTSIEVNETVNIGAAAGPAVDVITTANQTFNQAVLLTDTTLQSGEDIHFSGVVRSDGLAAHNLTLTGQGGSLVNNVTFAADLGQAGAGIGDVTQAAGRGTTTFSGGVIDGALSIATVAAVLDNPSPPDTLVVNGGNVTFSLDAGATVRSGLDAGANLVTFDVNRAGGADSFSMEGDASISTTNVSNRAVQVLVNQTAGGTGDASLGSIQAINGGVVIDVAHAAGGGAITDANAAAGNIAARQVALLSTNGVGDTDAIETRTALLAVNNTVAGAIQIVNTSDANTGNTLTIGEVREDAPGAALIASGLQQDAASLLSVTTSDALRVEQTVNSVAGGTTLKSGGAFELVADVSTTGGGDTLLESGSTMTVLADVTTTGGGSATFVSDKAMLLGDNTLSGGANETQIATNGGGDMTFRATDGNIEVRSHISSDQGDISFDAGRNLHFASAGDGADVVTNFASGGRIFGNAGATAGRAIPGNILFSNGATLDSGSGTIGDADYRASDSDVVTVTTVTTPSVDSNGTAKIRVVLNDPDLKNAQIYVDWADRADAGQSKILYPPVTNTQGGGIGDIRLDGNSSTSGGQYNGGAGLVTHELSYQYRRGNPNDINPFANIVIQVIVRPDHRAIPGAGQFGISESGTTGFVNASQLRSQTDLQNQLANGIILTENGRIVEFNSEVELTVPSQGLFAAIKLRENVVQVSSTTTVSRTPVSRPQAPVTVSSAQEFIEVVQSEDTASSDEAKLYFTEVLVNGSESKSYELDLSLLKDGQLEQLFKTFRNGLYKIQYKASGAEKVEVLFQLRVFNHKIVPVQIQEIADAGNTTPQRTAAMNADVRVVSVESIDHLENLLRELAAEDGWNPDSTETDLNLNHQDGLPPADQGPETPAAELEDQVENELRNETPSLDAAAEGNTAARWRRPVMAAGTLVGLLATTDGSSWSDEIERAMSQQKRSLGKHARLVRKLRK